MIKFENRRPYEAPEAEVLLFVIERNIMSGDIPTYGEDEKVDW